MPMSESADLEDLRVTTAVIRQHGPGARGEPWCWCQTRAGLMDAVRADKNFFWRISDINRIQDTRQAAAATLPHFGLHARHDQRPLRSEARRTTIRPREIPATRAFAMDVIGNICTDLDAFEECGAGGADES